MEEQERRILHNYVGKFCENKEEKLGRKIDKKAVALATNALYQFIGVTARDTESFTLHRGKKVPMVQDCLLCFRNNDDITSKINEIIEPASTKPKKRTKKAKEEKKEEDEEPPAKKKKTI
eukprot:TRINITY_DN13655_c0_g2_i3.p1 TRINITY_DN13655_c0_g2~~TRINITY_DN13655_c0_g2_i3.p1  ORF type:complete len:120 (+),score=37.70 TRINITY_DN13655_c0_g2_i3:1-360(+)